MTGLSLTNQNAFGTNWRRSFFLKVDEEGEFVENKSTQKTTLFCFIENQDTGDLYLNDTPKGIRGKAVAMCFSLPFYAMGMELGALVRLGYSITNCVSSIFQQQAIKDIKGKEFIRSFIGTPFYFLAAEGACMYMLVRPQEGRELFGKIESSWHGDATYRDLICYKNSDCAEFISDRKDHEKKPIQMDMVARSLKRLVVDDRVLFLAPCMLPRGNVDEKIQTAQGEKNHFVRVYTTT